MKLLRVVTTFEAVILVACGCLCLAFPDLIGAAVNQTGSADTYTRRMLGIALFALAIPLFQISREQDIAKFNHLIISYFLLPVVCLLGIGIAWAQNGFSGPPLFWWSIIAVLAVVTIVLLLTRARVARATEPAAIPVVSAIGPIASNSADMIKLHEVKMKYAWDWFQYHADQRLKGFNFFVVAISILAAGYGAAMKESITTPSAVESYKWFAFGIAVFGEIISIAFLLIEVRNSELVECGRRWLDSLEGGLGMRLRDDDEHRKWLPKCVGFLTGGMTPPEVIITHRFWFRFIYFLAAVGFIVACFFASRGFHWVLCGTGVP